MRVLIQIISLFLIVSSYAEAQKYPVSDIPSELRKGTDVVVRSSEQELNIINLGKGVYKEKMAITVLNSDGFGASVFYESYDKLSKIRSISIYYYDKNGKQIKKVKNQEIEDFNVTSSGAVYDDSRVKYFEPEEYDYPFTVEYSFEKQFESTAYFPSFRPIYKSRMAVQSAAYKVSVASGYELRYKPRNGAPDPTIDKNDDGDTYFWALNNQESIKTPYAGKAAATTAPHVLISPSKFEMEGYTGDMTTWEGLAKWQSKLNEGRDVISDEVKAEIDQLLSGVTDPREKTKLIYQYLQKNTRYVSIQLGIGGFQPFDAMNVITNGYGDCKALSNYTYSLLKYAGIDSHYVKIRAGEDEEDILIDFPSFQFNHVIVAVPMEKDTVWLECTSQKAPFNFLGSFTSNRHALMVTNNGGIIVKTPKYSEESNLQVRSIEATIDQEGNVVAKSKTNLTGLQYDNYYGLVDLGHDDQKKYLLNNIDLPVFDLNSFNYTEDRNSESPSMNEEIELSIRKYATRSGKRLFLVPNLLNRSNHNPPGSDDRKADIIVRFGYKDVDTILYNLPENYRLEFDVEGVEVESDFGQYKASYEFIPETNQLKYTRSILIKQGTFPAEKYAEYRNFHRKIRRSDASKLVLIGET